MADGLVAVLAMIAAACGGDSDGDDAATDEPTAEPVEASAAEPAEQAADEPAAEPAEQALDEPTDEPAEERSASARGITADTMPTSASRFPTRSPMVSSPLRG